MLSFIYKILSTLNSNQGRKFKTIENVSITNKLGYAGPPLKLLSIFEVA